MAAERQFQCQAMLGGALVGRGWRSGLALAAGQAATAVAERGRKLRSESTSQLGNLGGEADPWDMEDLEASHDHFRCSEDMDLQDIQGPQGSGDVGAESAAAQAAQCSAPLGNPGWDKHLELASGGRHSRKGWMGENHLLSIDSEPSCRHHGCLDNLQASPVDCTEAGRLIQTDTSLHSVLWNVTAGTSSVGSSPNTGKRPCCYSDPCAFFPHVTSRGPARIQL